MFPPETMHTTRPSTAPESAAASASAPAPSATTRARSARTRTAATAAPRDQHGVRVGQVFEQLETDRAVPRHHAVVLDRMDEEPVIAREAGFHDRAEPLVHGHGQHTAAEALDRGALRLRNVLRRD